MWVSVVTQFFFCSSVDAAAAAGKNNSLAKDENLVSGTFLRAYGTYIRNFAWLRT